MEDDRSFYERRLKEELARANTGADEGLQALHRRWAGLYRERLARLRAGRLAREADPAGDGQPPADRH
jgi:hypothetical protein